MLLPAGTSLMTRFSLIYRLNYLRLQIFFFTLFCCCEYDVEGSAGCQMILGWTLEVRGSEEVSGFEIYLRSSLMTLN